MLLNLYWKKWCYFEIAALHSCRLKLRLKPLVATCDFDNLFSKKVALQLATIRWCFSRISTKKIETPTFQNTFCWLLLLQRKNNREGELKCLLHTTLISNVFLMKFVIKENGTLWSQYARTERNGRFSIYEGWRRIW